MISRLKLKKGILRKFARALVALLYGTPVRNFQKTSLEDLPSPKRILILNGAHIGDIVISTSILPILRSAYPSAEIGFLVGSWAAMVIKKHPEVAYVHVVDHWWHNRSKKSRFQKYLQYRRTYRQGLSEIRERNYDLALCIYPYLLPDFMNLAWHAKIPVRLGFRESLFAALATTAVDLPKNPFLHQSALQAEILRPLHLLRTDVEKRHSSLPQSTEADLHEVCRLLKVDNLSAMRYRIIHLGTGARSREMTPAFWRELAANLAVTCTIVFTGQGEREASLIAEVVEGLGNCVNACDKLSWGGFVAAVRNAELLYGVESMAGHVAGAVGTPCVVIYSGAAGVARWRPEGSVLVMSNHLECAPCNLPNGCDTMACMRGIEPQSIIAIEALLLHRTPDPQLSLNGPADV